MTEAAHHVTVWPTVHSIPVSAVTDDGPPGHLRPPKPQDVAGGTGTGRDTTGGAPGGPAPGGTTTGPATGVGTARAKPAATDAGAGARANPAAEFGFSGDPGQHGVPSDDMLHAQRTWDASLATNRLDALGVTAERRRVETAPITTTVGLLVDGRPTRVREVLQSFLDHTDAHILALDLGDVDGAGAVVREFAGRDPERVTAWHVAEKPAWRGGTATWGACRAKLLRLDTSEVHVVTDGSVVLDGDAITPLVAAVHDGAVAAGWAGPERAGEEWSPAGPGKVAALGGELMAVRRAAALGTPVEEARDAVELSRALRGELVVPQARLPVRRVPSAD
ncbi:hypothetical protein ACWGH8_25700 [Nonomuraea muscovyensis]